MRIHRTESEGWLSNAYLVVADDDKTAVLVDGNGNPEPHLRRIEDEGLRVEVVLLTHHHADHVVLEPYMRFDAPVLAHEWTAAQLGDLVDQTLVDDEVITVRGTLRLKALHTPGHDAGHLAFLVDDAAVLTADVLFKGTVGGTRAPGATGFDDLKASLERLLALPDTITVHPGHGEATTIGAERTANPFIRAFADPGSVTPKPCTVGGEPAELLLWGPDYDGTNKAWVRFQDGTLHVTGGSQVARA